MTADDTPLHRNLPKGIDPKEVVMRTLLNTFLTLTVLMGVFAFARPAAAQDVTVRVRSIAATKQGDAFDSKLGDLKNELQKAFGGYSNFQLIDDNSFTLQQSQSRTTELPGGTQLTLTFHGVTADLLRIGLAIGDQFSTTLRASRGSTFFQAGLDYKNGMLILAITAK